MHCFYFDAGRCRSCTHMGKPHDQQLAGKELRGWLESSDVDHVVFSSCNAQSLARDLAALPSFTARQARVLDMFPQTTH